MNKRLFVILASLILIFSFPTAFAQVIDVCGTDTVILKTGNYQYGTVQWQQAKRPGKWTDIPNARNFEYKFLPKENSYYRAVVKFPDCPPSYSEVSYVQMPPRANAGIDRIVSAEQVRLHANSETGAMGSWSVLQGGAGVFEDSGNPYSIFSGSDTLYVLEWSHTNASGSSRDTMEIRFRELVLAESIVVVDSTDMLLSTFEELVNGIYKISFSEPLPSISESSILVGMNNGGYLRKVNSFSVDGNTFTMQTSLATLDDVITEGAIDFAQLLDFETLIAEGRTSDNFRQLNQLPTRLDLLTKPEFSSGKNHFYKLGERVNHTGHQGNELSFGRSDDGATIISINLPYPNLIEYGPLKTGLSGSYTFQPNLVADFDYTYLSGVKHARFGSSNGIEEKSFGLVLEAEAGVSVPEMEFQLFSITKDFLIFLGYVPVLVSVNLAFDGKFTAGVQAELNLSYGIEEKNNVNAYIEYRNGSWSAIYNKIEDSDFSFDGSMTGTIEQTFSFGPKISFTVFRFLGPYLDIKLNQKAGVCINQQLDWKAEADLSTEITIGATAKVIGHELVDIVRTWNRPPFYNYTFPHQLDIYSGNNQTYMLGEPLEYNPRIKVLSNQGLTLPGTRVKFIPKNGGEVSDSLVIASSIGLAGVSWIPGDSLKSELQVSVLDCEGNHIGNSPLIITAYADTICYESSLSVSAEQIDSIIRPLAHLGLAPYLYSAEGGTFAEQIPEIVFEYETPYTFSVKDAKGCIATINYTLPDPCASSDLSLNIEIIDNQLGAEAQGGLPPYVYALNQSPFTSVMPSFPAVPGESYFIRVKDAMDCEFGANKYIPFPCDGLILSLQAEESSITAIALGGNPPYRYSLGDTLNFSTNDFFSNLAFGVYLVYVKDSEGCISFKAVNVPLSEAQIGNQIWMKQNLSIGIQNSKVPREKYCNSVDMADLHPEDTCNDFVYVDHEEYGLLYDWEMAMEACPAGWRLPSDDDWNELINNLGGQEAAFDKLRSPLTGSQLEVPAFFNGFPFGTSLVKNPNGHPFWYEPNSATNESGFSALPAGSWRPLGSFGFSGLGKRALYWTSEKSNISPNQSIAFSINSANNYVTETTTERTDFLSIRCIKGTPTLQLGVNGSGGEVIGNGEYEAGTLVTIQAVPAPGHIFIGWRSDYEEYLEDVNSAITTVRMPGANITIEAEFAN